jgi:hypothetical protein
MTHCIACMLAGIHNPLPVCWLVVTPSESKGGRPHSSGTKSSSERRTRSGLSVTCEAPTSSRCWSGTHTTTTKDGDQMAGPTETRENLPFIPARLLARTPGIPSSNTSPHARSSRSASPTTSASAFSSGPTSRPSFRAAARNTSGNGFPRPAAPSSPPHTTFSPKRANTCCRCAVLSA